MTEESSRNDRSTDVDESTYRTFRYLYRSLLTLIGPLVVLGFYAYICVFFLQKPPINGIVLSGNVNGNWVFYAWFVVSVLMIDWARAGLANIEAYALMKPRFAPSTARSLMWHTDTNWANPVWWIRAVWSCCMYVFRRRSRTHKHPVSVPQRLWWSLSTAMVFLIAAIPLSGISMQTDQVLVKSEERATLFGPNETTYGIRPTAQGDFIRNAWQSGRQTTPQRGAVFYAPLTETTVQINDTYYDTKTQLYSTSIETFAGPALQEQQVAGRVWGLWSNISCKPVPTNQLRLIRSSHFNTTDINWSASGDGKVVNSTWLNTSTIHAGRNIPRAPYEFPMWLNERGMNPDNANHSITVAADGYTGYGSFSNGQPLSSPKLSPYFVSQKHDNNTLDHYNGRSLDEITTASFEIQIWESREFQDDQMDALIRNSQGLVQVVLDPTGLSIPTSSRGIMSNKAGERPWASFGVHCDVASQVGHADIDPARLQFSNFVQLPASRGLIQDKRFVAQDNLWPVQIQALTALTSNVPKVAIEATAGNGPGELTPEDPFSERSVWTAIHNSIGLKPGYVSGIPASVSNDGRSQWYSLLTPQDLQKSMYKLLGESVISMMDDVGIGSWQGDLYTLHQATYIIRGPVPWQYVMALLAIWTLITCSGALWILIDHRTRWAPSLNGFEMFKFGAQYSDEMNELTHNDFRKCSSPLDRIPGMVGLLGGNASVVTVTGAKDHPCSTQSTPNSTSERHYFLGLSENALGRALQTPTTLFTFDRRKAAASRW